MFIEWDSINLGGSVHKKTGCRGFGSTESVGSLEDGQYIGDGMVVGMDSD